MKYSIGLDIGVGSVGWACLTPEYRVLKWNGKNALGVREFEQAETAEARRLQRGTRRRYNRRVKRIQLLQESLLPIFNNEDAFLRQIEDYSHRWRQSNHFEQKTLTGVLKELGENPKRYPTMYHLRYALLTEERSFHPRLIYLALHHLVKYRGHFLDEQMKWDGSRIRLIDLIKEYFTQFNLVDYNEINIDQESLEAIESVLLDFEARPSDQRVKIIRIIGKEYQQAVNLILGLTTDFSQLFMYSPLAESYKQDGLKGVISDEDFEMISSKLQPEEQVIIEIANRLYQQRILQQILGDEATIAHAKVNEYKQFQQDLNWLKSFYNEHFQEEVYREIFITSKKNLRQYKEKPELKLLCLFDQYLRSSKSGDSFFKRIKKDIEKIAQNEETEYLEVLQRIEQVTFLRKLRSSDNSAIPHQNNVYEARKILTNQQAHHREISQEMIKRVEQIISFRIPYYIGPLVKDIEQSPFGWAERKNIGHVEPWNIKETIDYSVSAERFIQRMTNFCTVLPEEKVLPKSSLQYQMYEVLNELNSIQIRSTDEKPSRRYRLPNEVKQWAVEHVFKKYKTVTHKILIEQLRKSEYADIVLDDSLGVKKIYGTAQENRFSSSLSTWMELKKIFPSIELENQKMLEDVVYWVTVFDGTAIIQNKIKEEYPELEEKLINKLANLTFNGWGRFSEKLLNELPVDATRTVLEVMWEESLNWMEVLSAEKYKLEERIKKINQQNKSEKVKIRYSDIEALYGSPALKKGIWQAIQLVEELVAIFGEPEHIMIEFAREHQFKGKQTTSRKQNIGNIMKQLKSDEKELKGFLKKNAAYDEAKYRNLSFYLYVLQEGKCLYSGESLDPVNLQNYEIDHILPRSFVKDDSLDNLALVKSKMNAAKSNRKMPLEIMSTTEQYIRKQWWDRLRKNNLMTQRKYNRLMKEQFTDQDKESFIARQLVETRQITKHVKDLLEERFEETQIHTVNASIVTNLRNATGTWKVRSLNNKHHAIDALLAISIIQFIIQKYGGNLLDFNFKYQEAHQKWKKQSIQYGQKFFVFEDFIKSEKFHHFQTGEIINGQTYLQAMNTQIAWQTTKKIEHNKGAFYKETIFSPKTTEAKYTSEKVEKGLHGVHKEMKAAETYLVNYTELLKNGKKREHNRFIDLYIIEKYQLKNATNKEKAFLLAKKATKNEVINARIIEKLIKYQPLLIDNEPFYHVSEKEKHNRKQFQVTPALYNKLASILNGRSKEVEIEQLRKVYNEVIKEVERQFNHLLTDKNLEKMWHIEKTIDSLEEFMKWIEEVFKAVSASATRSESLGGRYSKVMKLESIQIVYQSITGLYYRKPKSIDVGKGHL